MRMKLWIRDPGARSAAHRLPVIDERMMRLWAMVETLVSGGGGHAAVIEVTGIRTKRIPAGHPDLST